MKCRVVIEIESGCVSAVYADGGRQAWPEMFVVDLDPAKVGESTAAQPVQVQRLNEASDIILEALPEPQPTLKTAAALRAQDTEFLRKS